MTLPPFRPDPRDVEEVVAELAAWASRRRLPRSLRHEAGFGSWSELLFDGPSLRDRSEPSRALLHALAGEHARLLRHLDGLPEKAFGWYLDERIGLEPRGPVPDRVPVVVEGDPARLPATLEAGTQIAGGKDHYGRERIYRTTEPLTVTGVRVLGAHSHRVGDPTDGEETTDAIVRRDADEGEVRTPFHPFGDAGEPGAAPAPHILYLESELLAASSGSPCATVTLRPDGEGQGGTGDVVRLAALLEKLDWEISGPEGYGPVEVYEPGRAVTPPGEVILYLGYEAPVGPDPTARVSGPHLRAAIPDPADPATLTREERDRLLGLAIREVRLQVEVLDVPPDAGYYDEGLLDVTRDFEPFGPVPRRGDAFYVRCDQAFGKPLESFRIHLHRLARSGEESEAPYELEAASYHNYEWIRQLTASEIFRILPEVLSMAEFRQAEFQVLMGERPEEVEVDPETGRAVLRGSTGALAEMLRRTRPEAEEEIRRATLKHAGLEEDLDMEIVTEPAGLEAVETGPLSWMRPWFEYPVSPPEAAIRWERRDGQEWTRLAEASAFGSVRIAADGSTGERPSVGSAADEFVEPTVTDGWDPDVPLSARTSLAGTEGHLVRAQLVRGDFGWRAYQDLMAENARAAMAGDTPDVDFRPPPDPPVLSRVRIGYRTTEASTGSSDSGDLRVLARSGLAAPGLLLVDDAGGTARPFPDLPDGNRAVLYLGFSDTGSRGHVVSLFADVAPASACGGEEDPDGLAWEYPSAEADGSWRELRVDDGTLGFRQTGLVRFVAPPDWATGAPAADVKSGLWIRVFGAHPDRAGTVRALAPDAVEARYRPAPGREEEDPTPGVPLPAGGLTELKTSVPGIKGVSNPVASRGGTAPEAREDFLVRGRRRLRHRGRAVDARDVETLLRTRFPELAHVRCLPHHSREGPCAPGWIGVLALPRVDLRSPDAGDRLPVADVVLAERIRSFLRERAPVHARVAILCPEYLEVSIGGRVQLRPDVPAEAGRRELNAELRGFLHPLGRAGRAEGRALYRSSVVRFLEGRREVARATSIAFTRPAGGGERLVPDDPCLGFLASAEEHALVVEAAL